MFLDWHSAHAALAVVLLTVGRTRFQRAPVIAFWSRRVEKEVVRHDERFVEAIRLDDGLVQKALAGWEEDRTVNTS